MSKEKEPVRTRRELREANSEQTQGAAGYPPVPFVPAPSTPAVDPRGRRTQPSGPAGPADGTAVPGGQASDKAAKNDAAKDDAGTSVPRERSSQTRAKDRAALRAYKELVDSAQAQVNPLPSRRALRQAQLDAERAPVTSINPVVPPAKAAQSATAAPASAVPPAVPPAATPARASSSPASSSAPPASALPSAPASSKAPRPTSQVKPSPTAPAPQGKPAPTAPAPQGKPAPTASAPQGKPAPHGKPAPTAEAHAAGHRSRMGRRAADAAPDALPDALPVNASTPAAPSPDPEAGHAAASASTAGALPPPPIPGLVPGAPYPSVSAGPVPVGGQPPSTEELQVLAGQRAQAERAAVLDQRAQARERLAQESAKSRRTAADPTATNNLAMVTPMEFVDVPGVDRPVMRPPSTTHVPIVTRSAPKLARPRKAPGSAAGSASMRRSAGSASSGKAASARDANAERFDAALAPRAVHRPGPGNRPLTGGRSGTLKRAEAMVAVARPHAPAQPEAVTRTQMPPMPADYAHGLEPLDAVTAGLGRTKRNLLIQWGSIILGGAALVVGAVMFITALAR